MGFFEVFTNRQTLSDYYFGEISRDKALQRQGELIERSRQVNARTAGDNNNLREEFASLKDEIRGISYGIDAFHADYVILQGEEIWLNKLQLETQNAILQEIRLPEFKREARDYRVQAEESYHNDFYEDALYYFLEAEKQNRQDFSVLRSIGNIYLYRLIDLPKAYEYFLKAAKYSKPYDSNQSAEAQYYAAFVCGAQQELQKAAEHASDATKLDSQYWDAFYLHAGFSAMLGGIEPALSSVEAAIKGNPRFYESARSDKMFDGIRSSVDALLERLLLQVRRQVADGIQNLKQAIDTARKVGATDASSAALGVANELDAATKRASYSGLRSMSLRAEALYDRTFEFAEQALAKTIEQREGELRRSELDRNSELYRLRSAVDDLKSKSQAIDRRKMFTDPGGYFALYIVLAVVTFGLGRGDLCRGRSPHAEQRATWGYSYLRLFVADRDYRGDSNSGNYVG